jgi:pimeloyl-ACP methyl ester carboxylesterase
MIQRSDLPEAVRARFPTEYARYREFLVAHTERTIASGGAAVPFCVCGDGPRTILTLAGGFGGVDLIYDLIAGLETRHRVAVVDISAFDEPDAMSRGIDAALDAAGVGRVVLLGQSLSGILGQLYFRRRPDRVDGLVLAHTLAPRVERCKSWAMVLLRAIPFPLLRALMIRKLGRLARIDRPMPPEVVERRGFAGALLAESLRRGLTRARLVGLMQLAWRFNEAGAYREEELRAWAGRVLLVSSADEPSHADAELLKTSLPRAELLMLPSGYGHVSPQVHRDQFLAAIHSFVDGLDAPDQ